MSDLLNFIKLYLKIQGNGFDIFLNKLILSAIDNIDNYCRQPIFLKTENIKNLLFDDDKTIILPYTVPMSVNIIEMNDVMLNPTEYSLFYENKLMKIEILESFSVKETIFKVNITSGWDFEDLPGDINMVLTEMVVRSFKDSVQGKDDFGKGHITTTQSTAYTSIGLKDMWREWKRILDRYRLITF